LVNDLKRKLPKKLEILYDEFYKLKRTGYWANITRTDKNWLFKYTQIMILGEPRSIFEENSTVMNQLNSPKRGRDKERDSRDEFSNNNFVVEKTEKKNFKNKSEVNKNQYRRKFNPTFNELPEENYREEKSFHDKKLHAMEENFDLDLIHQDSRKTGNFNNNHVNEDFEIDYLNNLPKNVKKTKVNKNHVISNEKVRNPDLDNNFNEYPNSRKFSYDENNQNNNDDLHEASFSQKPLKQDKSKNKKNLKLDIPGGSKENSPRLRSMQSTPQNNIQINDYDNRPIRANPKNNYDLSEFPLGDGINPDGENDENQFNTEDNLTNKKLNKKKKRIEKIQRKKPKYDARKAIEEAAKKEENNQGENLNDERGAFRKFLKEMRGETTKEQPKEPNSGGNKLNSHNNNEEISLDKKKSPMGKNEKGNVVQGGGGFGSGPGSNLDLSKNDTNNNDRMKNKKEVEDDSQRKKKENERNMRKKLHEMEKSPPPRVSIKIFYKKF
jgi:hypothetical protein